MVDFYYCSKDSSADLIELYQDVFYSLLVEETPQVYLEEGQRDGSVRADIDPRVYTATVIAALVSLAEQITANKETTQALYGVGDADAMMEVAAGAFVARAKKGLRVGSHFFGKTFLGTDGTDFTGIHGFFLFCLANLM